MSSGAVSITDEIYAQMLAPEAFALLVQAYPVLIVTCPAPWATIV